MKQHQGKCHCGKNTFSLSGDPVFQFVCYCKSCRTLHSSGHLCGMVFNETQFTPAQNTQTYSYPGGSGNPIILHFCPHCSTQLYGYPTQYAGTVVIKANALENSDFTPQQILFSESAFSWDKPLEATKP